MQFKKIIATTTLIGLIALTFGTRLLNKNNNNNNNNNNIQAKTKTSLFASENFQITEGEKLDDLMEQRRAAMRNMKIKNPKSK
jgi:hypothetical protein